MNEMRKLMESLDKIEESYTEPSTDFGVQDEHLHYKGYPVYAIAEGSTLFQGWFAFAGDQSAWDDIEGAVADYYPPHGYGDLMLNEVGGEYLSEVESGKLVRLPIVKAFSENQLRKIGQTLTRLNERNINMNPGCDIFTTM